VANSFHRPHFSRVRIFVMRFLFRHASFTRWDTFLQAVADFLPDLLFPPVLSHVFWRGSTARLQTLRRFLDPPTSITAASPLEITWRFSIDCIIPGSGSVSVASRQVVVWSKSDCTDCIAAFASRWMVSFNLDRMT
jgi:hypothetical protein